MTTTVEFITALFYEVDEQLPGFSANNVRVHVPRKARQSLAGVGLQGDAKGRSGH